MMFNQEPMNFLLIGNPGVGKSTILNGLIGVAHFKSGVSLGQGMTYQLDVFKPEGQPHTFMDTPGLSDAKMRKQAAEAITQALKKDGNYKVFFIVTLESGRVRPDDATTMKLVLEAAPAIGNKYGIIINKVTKGIMDKVSSQSDAFEVILSSLWADLPEESKTKLVTLNGMDDLLEDRDNILQRPPEALIDFIRATPGTEIRSASVRQVHEDVSVAPKCAASGEGR